MTKIHKLKNFIKRHYIISALILIVVLFGGYKVFGKSGGNNQLYTVGKTDVVQKVIVSGNTKAVHAVALGFETSGKVARVSVSVGSKVSPGQSLASLEQGEQYANLLKARADVTGAEATLSELKGGTRPEEIANAVTEVDNAKAALSTKMLDSFTKADDVVHNSIDHFFTNPKSQSPSFNLPVADSQLKIDLDSGRLDIESLLVSWSANVTDISKTGVAKTETNLLKIKSFVDKVAQAINTQTPSTNTSQTTLDGYKADISSARTNINTAISNIATAKANLSSAEGLLALKQKGNTPEAIQTQEARVAQYKAAVQSVEAQLAKMTLRSPIYGTVTVEDAKVGEIVTPGKSVISIISSGDLEMEANVSEVSIGKVAIGNPVAITFDAFPGETFDGTVSAIEPAETIIDGVVNYKVTVSFAKQYPQIKSGLTSRLEIMTAVKKDTISVPQYALIKKDSGTFVSKQTGQTFTEVSVTVGITGQDGSVEILSGLSVGDVIQAIATK